MVLLLLFAALAGAGTAVSPCVLPVLPAVLSAGATGGPRRPLGVVAGLTATFTITVVGLARVVQGVGVGGGALRDVAIVVVAAAGVIALVPHLEALVTRALAPMTRLGPRAHGSGFWSGVGVGGALGFLYAPCAGPILAAVITVGAATSASVAVGLAYALGSAAVLLVLALGGRGVAERVRRGARGPVVRRAVGVVLVATAALMATGADLRFQDALAAKAPAFLVDPTASLERSRAVQTKLGSLGHHARFAAAHSAAHALPVLGTAPDFTGTQRWFNTPGGRPLSLAALRGKVVLVDFWTYTCINCIRTLPYLKAWDRRYRSRGLVIVGVHTPEFDFERDAGNVRDAVRRLGLRYPVVQDNARATWDAWGNQAWPADYLIDAGGRVRTAHAGEGDYAQTEQDIRALLAAAGARALGGDAAVGPVATPGLEATPETYVGTARAQGFAQAPTRGTHSYPGVPTGARLPQNAFALGGTWTIGPQPAEAAARASIDAEVVAKDVYVVLSARDHPGGRVHVLLDGRPIPARLAGADVRRGAITVAGQRLYRVVALPATQEHRVTLRFDRGVAAYAFTFG